jgi:hypothetical protein
MAENMSLAIETPLSAVVPTEQELGINMGAVSTYKIDPLKEDNWVAWCSCMMTMLKFQHAYGHVEGTVPKPDDLDKCYKWERHVYLAQILIKNNLSDGQMVILIKMW